MPQDMKTSVLILFIHFNGMFYNVIYQCEKSLQINLGVHASLRCISNSI